ncbi:MAG: 5-formyltetrahydrofolate cyclo-ligase (EC [uncultured Thiotrichaceae bacterium]|uniref:5-formyltetrahydrofolate cyclo-ligase n=1 Tax=uncultured Thiotrichaceae bacterium TaxID=298394 RepID=A0A6S6UE64_9GAMM|nr:MAG: 5-formyltetrahydrofolate cyclo-ligase (EC [uncultured Thiotrichaceae bacterium]
MDKTQQRRELIKRRKQLTHVEIEAKSTRILDHLDKSEIYQTAKYVALYLAINGEADPRALLNQSSIDKHFYLPVIDHSDGIKMHFAKYQLGDPLTPNEFGILEPELTPESAIPVTKLDLVITPLVGFDDRGNRLGMGGGYYDRTFAFKQNTDVTPYLMGFAYDFQSFEYIPENIWDVKLDGIATEKYVKKFHT